MAQPQTLVLRAPGANCDVETAHAFEKAGATAERLHINHVIENPHILKSFQILCIPGGFSFGDDLGAGRILGTLIQTRLADQLKQFRDDGKLVLGVCNGFQVLMNSGLLLDEADFEPGSTTESHSKPAATVCWNTTGRFEDRWVNLATHGDRCVFLKNIDRMYLPIAHAEGRFVPRDEAVLAKLEANGQLAIRYRSADDDNRNGGNLSGELEWPDNPNGSVANVAGVCDKTGRVFGLMPHPERYIDRLQHPRWTRGEGSSPGDGLQVFKNAVEYFA